MGSGGRRKQNGQRKNWRLKAQLSGLEDVKNAERFENIGYILELAQTTESKLVSANEFEEANLAKITLSNSKTNAANLGPTNRKPVNPSGHRTTRTRYVYNGFADRKRHPVKGFRVIEAEKQLRHSMAPINREKCLQTKVSQNERLHSILEFEATPGNGEVRDSGDLLFSTDELFGIPDGAVCRGGWK